MKAFLVIIIFSMPIRGEWFSSFSHMEKLLGKEADLLKSLSDYITYENSRLNYLEEALKIMNTTSCSSASNVRACMENPINQYALMKRLAYVWEGVRSAVSDRNASEKFLWTIDRNRPTLPTSLDVFGSISGLIRIQLIYGISAHDMALGIIGKSVSGISLSAGDCYDIGDVALANNQSQICAEWQETALNKMRNGDNSINAEKVLYLLARCVYAHGNLPMAYETLREIARFAPDFIEMADFYRHVMAQAEQQKLAPFLGNFYGVLEKYAHEKPLKNHSLLEQLCQGKKPLTRIQGPPLRCYLWDGNRNPRLLFRPVKVEIESKKPFVARLYNFISDDEIEILKKVSSPLMYRAKVSNGESGGRESDSRVTKTVFLEEKRFEIVAKINRRVADVTKFDSRYVEELSISNYGVGGHYDLHMDAFGIKAKEGQNFENKGDRIATLLMYLSDVDQGGNTVFPNLRIVAKPIKGSAILWFNLLTNGTIDRDSLHSGCPVMTGDKWIINLWVREKAISTCSLCESRICPENTHKMRFY
uniref:prolyl 4-hydroxylase subunit alpha-2-like n=1 Tax=Styela clava TaxID=7725 RepID=UPI0019397D1F|nr:prolyl 4-hydroxylase subunit alpha-2-like [Styela clava]